MKKKFSKILGVGLTLALLCSLLLTAAPVMALSQPTVTPGSLEISKNTSYTITFTLAKDLAAGEDIVITFPALPSPGTTFAAGLTVGDVTMSATSGLGSTAFAAVPPASIDQSVIPVLRIRIPAAGAGGAGQMNIQGKIGRGALVEVVIAADIVSPDTIGVYNLTVGTADATPTVIEAAVTSAPYTLAGPTILPLPGVVERYNSAMVPMEQTNTIQTAIGNAVAGDTILVGPGYYDEDLAIGVAITLIGDAATTFIKDVDPLVVGGGTVTISAKSTFDGFTVVGRTFGVKVDTAAGTTVQNCVLSGTTGANTAALDIDVGIAGTPTVSIDNTITVPTGGIGIEVAATVVATSTNDIITATGTGTGVVNNGTLTLTGASISGASGIGFQSLNAGAVSTITGSTFSGLHKAILVTNGTTVDAQTNTITGCGDATTTALKPAIDVLNVGTSVTIANNTIDGCVDEILQVANVAGLGGKVFLNFNTITSPAKGIDNLDTTVKVDATNNWWGVNTGPAVTSTNATTTPFLVTPVSSGTMVAGQISLTGKTTVGVDVAGDAGTANIAVASYPTFPVAAPGVPLAYSDVYVSNVAGMATVTIRLYGPVTTGTTAYAWSDSYGLWVACSTQVVNQFAGCVVVTVSAATTPTLTDLAGLPFVIADPTATTVLATAPVIAAPTSGDDDVSLTPTFAWSAVFGADGYYFELADNANFVAPLVKLDGDLGRLITTAYAYVTELPYSEAYYWRVKAVSGTIGAGDLLESAWTSGVFITMDEPPAEPEPEARMWTCPVCGLTYSTRAKLEAHAAWAHLPEEPADIIIESPDIEVIVPLPDVVETQITPTWIYIIIGVGAVLVIALLVLIVRTRRVA